MATKLQKILNKKNLTQGDFILLAQSKYGIVFTRSYISKICSGNITNYTVKTALIISKTLEVNLNDIIDTNSEKIMVKETQQKAIVKGVQNAIKKEEKEKAKEELRQIRKEQRKVEREKRMKLEHERKIAERLDKDKIKNKRREANSHPGNIL